MNAFRDNRQLHRNHMREKLDSQFKKVILDKWDSEVVYHQRVLANLAGELYNLQWFDEDVWMKIIKTSIHKERIQNQYFFIDMHRAFKGINENPEAGEGLY